MAKRPKPKVVKPKVVENVAKNVETKSVRKELAAQLGEAVFKREKMTMALNKQSELCNNLATAIDKLEG